MGTLLEQIQIKFYCDPEYAVSSRSL